MMPAPGFEPEQQGSTISRFGKRCAAKSSRMPRSRHILCRARESFWARQVSFIIINNTKTAGNPRCCLINSI